LGRGYINPNGEGHFQRKKNARNLLSLKRKTERYTFKEGGMGGSLANRKDVIKAITAKQRVKIDTTNLTATGEQTKNGIGEKKKDKPMWGR